MNEVKSELRKMGIDLHGTSCLCPFHEDKRPSASVYLGEDGKERLKCFVCGYNYDVYDIRERNTGKTFKEQKKMEYQPPKIYKTLKHLESVLPKVEDRYQYTNPDTKTVELIIYRCIQDGNKTFRQASPSKGGWIMKSPPKPWPILNRKKIKESRRVVVVEGEKCVKHLYRAGIMATTSPGGALNAVNADWSPLAGKSVILWPDNDDPGRKYMRDVRAKLEMLDPAPIISMIDPVKLELEEKQDAADLPYDRLTEIIEQSRPEGMAAVVGAYINRAIKGDMRPIYWPWPIMSKMTSSLIPSTLTLLCGSPGASKSLMLIQSLAYWHDQGIKACCLMMEENALFHVMRALAQRTGETGVTDTEWIENNPEVMESIASENSEWLDSFGCTITSNYTMGFNHTKLLEWIEAKARTHRVVAVDPISLVDYEGNQWEAEKKLIADLQVLVKNHKCSIILVTHPTKGGADPSLQNLYGSSSFARSTQSVIWLENHKRKESPIKYSGMELTDDKSHTRTLHIVKARNSGGMGHKIAFDFEKAGLTLNEIGEIKKP